MGAHSRFAMWANAMWAIDGSALPFRREIVEEDPQSRRTHTSCE